VNGPTIPTDSQLLAEYLDAGRGSAFEQLVRRHAALVSSVCRGILRQSHDVDDATQAAFLTLTKKASTLRDHPTIAGWLHRVAWHVAMRARESRDLRQQREGQPTIVDVMDHSRSPADEEHRAALRAAVYEHLAAMPEKYRAPLILHHLEGWSEAEVASMLGIKQGTASGRLSRGRQMLRDRLERRGVGLGAVAVGWNELFGDSTVARDSSEAANVALADAPSPRVAALSASAVRMLSARRRQTVLTAVAGMLLLSAVGIGGAVLRSSTATGVAGVTSATTAPAMTGQITGTVLDPRRRTLEGVTVRIYESQSAAARGRAPVANARTDSKGEFHVESLAPREGYFIVCVIERPEFLFARKSAVVNAGEVTRLGEIVLQAGRY
jgi:RNA polymerase sigma factor (sigma-70 family)